MKNIFPDTPIIKGFSIIETMAVIVIGLVLIGITGLGVNRAMQNSKLDQTAVTIRMTATELDMFISERGLPAQADEESIEDMALVFINEFNTEYASMTFDAGTLEVNGDSFTVMSLLKTDAWRNKYLLYYSADNGIFAISSAGPNAAFEFFAGTDIENMNDMFAAIICK